MTHRILHFLIDEKFTGFIINMFEKISLFEQQYIVTTSGESTRLKFHHPDVNVIPISEVNDLVKTFNPDLIIFHSLFTPNLLTLEALQFNKTICWFSWGGDIALGHTTVFRKSHEPLTFAAYFKPIFITQAKHAFWSCIKSLFPKTFQAYYRKRTGEIWPNYILNKHFHRISIINTVTPNEQGIFKKYGFKGTFIHIPIGTIEYLTNGLVPRHDEIQAINRIFIGHSSFSQNNQLDVIDQLHKLGFSGEIICSLSYGDKQFAELITKQGTSLFGGQFIPLTEYLQLEDYFSIVKSCDLYINNSIIQQGLGNILTAIYLGVPVALNEHGLIYQYLQDLNVHCYGLKKDLQSLLENKPTVSKSVFTTSRENIDAIYSEKQVLGRIHDFLNSVVPNDD